MYLRTTQRRNTDGTVVRYFQLAHNVRDAESGTSIARVIHSFGRADEIDENVLRRLCASIARVVGLEVRVPGTPAAAVGRLDDVLPQDVEQVRTRSYGVVLAVDALWTRLGIGRALLAAVRAEGRSLSYERALLAMVANRLDDPTSKLGVWDRWLDTVHLPGGDSLPLDQFYEAMDLVHRHQYEVERSVFFETANLLNLVVDLVFYDTTTCSFAIDEADGEGGLRRYGHSKEDDNKVQVVVALAVTRDGIPVRSWVLPGNTADVSTIERVKKDLREWKLGRVLLVGDSGMNSEDNRDALARACGKYVLACRTSSVKEVSEAVLSRAGRYKEIRPNLRVKDVVVGEGERRRRYVVCHNPQRAERERLHREQVVRELEAEFAKHTDRASRRRWVAELRTSGRYGRYVKLDRQGELQIDRAAVRDAARLDGKWVLITNDDSLSSEDVADAYLGSQVIERGFRTMKSGQIEVRPMFHWLPRRIEAHVKLCVLALLISRVAELACGIPWPRIRDLLSTIQVTEYDTPTHRFFRVNRLPEETLDVLRKLEIEPPKQILAVQPHG
ncbi:MAG: IS1634 family transposase [Actinobacteria bacterium]|nr:IS1634 family transposase [Actinomycetota bacterium]